MEGTGAVLSCWLLLGRLRLLRGRFARLLEVSLDHEAFHDPAVAFGVQTDAEIAAGEFPSRAYLCPFFLPLAFDDEAVFGSLSWHGGLRGVEGVNRDIAKPIRSCQEPE